MFESIWRNEWISKSTEITINIHNNDDVRGAEPWVPEGKEDAQQQNWQQSCALFITTLRIWEAKTERLTRKETIEREPEISQHTSLSNSQNTKTKEKSEQLKPEGQQNSLQTTNKIILYKEATTGNQK